MSLFDTIFNTDVYKNYSDVRGIQNIYTPIDKIEKATNFEFASSINENTKEIGIIFNFEFIENLLKKCNKNYINNIHITFFYDSEFDLEEAKFIAYKYNFKNISFESIEEFNNSKNIKDLEKVMANKKFDIVFSNPPYEKNLHLKILESVFNISEDIIFIHPDNWLTNPFRDYEKSTKKKQIVKKIGPHIKNICYLSAEKFNAIFGTSNFFGVSIIHYNKNNKDFDTTQFLNKNKILDKILTKCIDLPSFRSKFKCYSDHYVNFVFIRRRTHNYLKWHEDDSSKITQGIIFNSLNEKDNFIKSLDTWVYAYLNISEYKLENSAYAPFFGEETNPRTGLKGYEGEWSNEDFYQYFGITEEEQKYIEETMKQFKK
jgi:hypothetical protein